MGWPAWLPTILVTRRPDRVGRLVLASFEAFDNTPPGLPGEDGCRVGQKLIFARAAELVWQRTWQRST